MVQILSETLLTQTSKKESDTVQDKLYFHPENKAAEDLSSTLCAPYPSSTSHLDQLRVLMNTISLQVHQQYHTNSINGVE